MTTHEVIAEGKTKRILTAEHDGMVVIESKDDITKNDNPDETRRLDCKARFSTATTCAVFELLKAAGLPVAYGQRLSETEFLAPKCEMIPLEVVVRRYAVGSYLKRYPHLEKSANAPYRFHQLVCEFFLKTTGGRVVGKPMVLGNPLPNDPITGQPIDDPLISNSDLGLWRLYHPKHPAWTFGSYLDRGVSAIDILPPGATIGKIEAIARKVFLVLESAWAQLGCRLIDFKIELGIDSNGNLLVADVIDNDSWRLRTSDWQELSKQLFRDNHTMEKISDSYELVAKLAESFRIPSQAIVLWRGSESDPLPDFSKLGITKHDFEFLTVELSGHKSPASCLNRLEAILREYPEGGVIIALVGMSNGLGPMLSARTSWPVIGLPITASVMNGSEDVWSSLRLPSRVPMVTVLSPNNAVLAALNILAQKNPVAYMHRQLAIEALDTNA